jgi:hypothetical protein
MLFCGNARLNPATQPVPQVVLLGMSAFSMGHWLHRSSSATSAWR